MKDDITEISLSKYLKFTLLLSLVMSLIVFSISWLSGKRISPTEYISTYILVSLFFLMPRFFWYMDKIYIHTIRKSIKINLIPLSYLYCLLFIIVSSIIIRISNNYLVNYLNHLNVIEYFKIRDSGYLGFLNSLADFFDFLHYHYILVISIISSLFIWIYTSITKASFICPHCLTTIYFRNISNITCPLCKTTNHSRFELLFYCSSCRQSMDYFFCPHCQRPININDKYDHQALLDKRREVAKLKPLYLTGLRELYNLKQRLPQFICKHCLKTLIAKNYNLTCPHCKASYLVTDNRTQIQIGDVKIKNYRYVGDESTMEKVLFDSCIQCGGMIEAVRCYHDDCGKEIDLREDYNEIELLRRRYEQENS